MLLNGFVGVEGVQLAAGLVFKLSLHFPLVVVVAACPFTHCLFSLTDPALERCPLLQPLPLNDFTELIRCRLIQILVFHFLKVLEVGNSDF